MEGVGGIQDGPEGGQSDIEHLVTSNTLALQPRGRKPSPQECAPEPVNWGLALTGQREVPGCSEPITPPARAAPSQVWLGSQNKGKSPRKFSNNGNSASAEFLWATLLFTCMKSYCIVHLTVGEYYDMQVIPQQNCEKS